MIENVEELEVVVAHSERATLRVGDVFLKIDADQTRTDVEERVALGRLGPVDDAGDLITGDEDVVDLQVAVDEHRYPRPERSLGELAVAGDHVGGQDVVEKWVLSLGLTPIQFMILAQAIIFLLGWPLEWTEIIVIFMPIFIPLLDNFGVDPLFFGLLVALNLQTAFLSPPVAMAAFYLKGVAPPHVTLNQIFGGMMPFMGIQVVAARPVSLSLLRWQAERITPRG